MWKNPLHIDDIGGRVVSTEEQRRMAFVELERPLWRRVLGRLRGVASGASVYVGFAVSEQPAQELA
jgi:hypothetical protein